MAQGRRECGTLCEIACKKVLPKEKKEDISFILRRLRYKFIYYSDGRVIFTRTSNHMGIGQMIIHPISDIKMYNENTEMQAIEDGWFYFEGK